MRSVLSLNHTDNQQNCHGNYPTCNGSYGKAPNQTDHFQDQPFNILSLSIPNTTLQLIFILILLITIVGMVQNGKVIWLLGFCLKRNNFTIYVLHLAIADFGTLMCTSLFLVLASIPKLKVDDIKTIQWIFWQCVAFTYCVGLYLLTAIGVERCLSILFPIWVRCHRPKYLSTIVSILCWTVSALFIITESLLLYFCLLDPWITVFKIMSGVNLFIFTPVMVVSTLILFMKLPCRHGKQHILILIILLFFIITAVPYGIFFFLTIIDCNSYIITQPIFDMVVTVNSSINPIIYFFVGNQCNCRSREPTKVMFQRVFKDETEHEELRRIITT